MEGDNCPTLITKTYILPYNIAGQLSRLMLKYTLQWTIVQLDHYAKRKLQWTIVYPMTRSNITLLANCPAKAKVVYIAMDNCPARSSCKKKVAVDNCPPK